MSLLIVAIHSKAFYGDFCSVFIAPLTSLAVPVFFILSSFFYFRKSFINGFELSSLGNYVKRIALLYLFWFIVNLPIIIIEKRYFIQTGITDLWRFVMDILFRYTYYGSWFFSSLVLAVVIVYLAHYQRIVLIIVITISLSLLFYVHLIDYLPTSTHVLYNWIVINIRPEIQLTVMESLPWVCIGYLLAKVDTVKIHNSGDSGIIILLCVVITSACMMIFGSFIDNAIIVLLSRIACAITLVILAGNLSIPNSIFYLHLRKLSVLFFMIHFDVLYYVNFLTGYVYNSSIQEKIGYIPTYLIVLVITFILSETIIYLMGKRHFSFLKYSC